MSKVPGESPSAAEAVLPVGDRLTFAARQIAIMAVTLLVAGAMTDSARPEGGSNRDIVESPFRWAILAWIVLLLFNAIGFDRSQMRRLEGKPLVVAIGLGVVVFVVGIASLDGGSATDRLLFLVLNSAGVVMFTWAIIGLGYLLWRRVDPAAGSRPPDPAAGKVDAATADQHELRH